MIFKRYLWKENIVGEIMDHSILLKGNKYGIVVVLDESMDFGKLLEKV